MKYITYRMFSYRLQSKIRQFYAYSIFIYRHSFVSFNIAYGYDLNDYGLGYVCKSDTAKEFLYGLEHFILMDKNKYRDISNKCIKIAKEKYSNVVQIKNFINIVNS